MWTHSFGSVVVLQVATLDSIAWLRQPSLECHSRWLTHSPKPHRGARHIPPASATRLEAEAGLPGSSSDHVRALARILAIGFDATSGRVQLPMPTARKRLDAEAVRGESGVDALVGPKSREDGLGAVIGAWRPASPPQK